MPEVTNKSIDDGRTTDSFFSHDMGQGSVENYEFLYKLRARSNSQPAKPQLGYSQRAKGSLTNRLINRLDYSPQKAKRAGWDGADIELIIAALIHDVNKTLHQKIIPRCPQ